MKIQLIRNATLLVEYGGIHFLVDPMLSEKGTFPPFPNSRRKDDSPNPLVELPMPVKEILHHVDAVFLSHLHIDHWDNAAIEALPNGLKILCRIIRI
jgi:L-ascorbate metabolism protein UlaG (beta-lactamase superfamily)